MSDEILIGEKINDINSSILDFCKEILSLDSERALKILPFILNISIMLKLFPGIIRRKQIMGMLKDDKNALANRISDKVELFNEKLERMWDFCLFLLLKYKSNNKITKSGSDFIINSLFINEEHLKLIEDFFIYNSFPKDIPIKFIRNLRL